MPRCCRSTRCCSVCSRCWATAPSPPGSSRRTPAASCRCSSRDTFPDWFAGVADAAIVIGALVPAAIMCIGAANLFASNVFREFSPERSPVETLIAKVLTLAICAFSLLFIFFVPVPYAIDFQLLGGALMLQIFPAFVLGLWTRWFHSKALLAGWACGLLASCAMAYASRFTSNFTLHAFGGSLTGFIALYGLAVNLFVSILITMLVRAMRLATGSRSHHRGRLRMSETINPSGWPRPSGYANGIVAEGRYLAISGQIGWNERNELVGEGFLEQARQALRNVIAVLQAAGGRCRASRTPDVVRHRHERIPREPAGVGRRRTARSSANIIPRWRSSRSRLLEDGAKVEIEATAIIPSQ